MAPAVLEADARANVDEGQVTVDGVLADRREDPPGGDGAGDEQEPREGGEPEVAENPVVEPPQYGGYPRSASGTGLWGSGPTYSDCGRMRRLLATCSRTCAVHPAAREDAKVGVKYSLGKPIACSTPAE
jgi:hypothetical protein